MPRFCLFVSNGLVPQLFVTDNCADSTLGVFEIAKMFRASRKKPMMLESVFLLILLVT